MTTVAFIGHAAFRLGDYVSLNGRVGRVVRLPSPTTIEIAYGVAWYVRLWLRLRDFARRLR